MSNLQKYGTWTPEARKAEADEVAKAGGGDFLKLPEGKTVVRFLPPRVGSSSPFVISYQHYVKKPGDAKNTSVVCPRHTAKRQCPICDFIEDLRKTGNPADREQAYQMRAGLRVFANVIDRNQPDRGPQTFGMGKKMYEQLLKLAEDDTVGGNFTIPEPPGYDIVIVRTGTGKDDTEYQIIPARTASSLGNLDWIDSQPDLSWLSQAKSAAEIMELLGIKPDAAAAAARDVGGGQSAGARVGSAQPDPLRTAADLAKEEEEITF